MFNYSQCSLSNTVFKSHSIYVVLIVLTSFAITSCTTDKNKKDINSETSTPFQESFQVATDLDPSKLKPISDAYMTETGVKVDWTQIDSGLLNSSAASDQQKANGSTVSDDVDMLMLHSAYSIADAKSEHILQPIGSELLSEKIPTQYADTSGYWYGLTTYGRTIVYNKNKVNEAELLNYAGLADDKWNNRLCMTDILSSENQAIAKMMTFYRGANKTPEILGYWLRNMKTPSISDNDILTKIEKGNCDVGVVDSNIFWDYAKQNPNTKIRLMWSNQINNGTITNAISVGLLNTSRDAGYALRFIEWLVSDKGQALLAFNTSTFPIVSITDEKVNMQVVRPEWTKFKADKTPLIDIIENDKIIEPIEILEEPEVAEDIETAVDEMSVLQ